MKNISNVYISEPNAFLCSRPPISPLMSSRPKVTADRHVIRIKNSSKGSNLANFENVQLRGKSSLNSSKGSNRRSWAGFSSITASFKSLFDKDKDKENKVSLQFANLRQGLS